MLQLVLVGLSCVSLLTVPVLAVLQGAALSLTGCCLKGVKQKIHAQET